MRKRQVAGTVAALAAAVSLGCGATAEASAATAAPRVGTTSLTPQINTCPVSSGYACFWVDSYRGGAMGKVSGNNSNYMNLSNSSGCTAYPGTWNDCISSIENQGTQCTVYFWTDAGYTGRYHSLSIGDRVDDFATGYNDPSFNDSISSNHWCTPS
ncbi:peptidase inhibitor family I36 protein [Streptomyces sp. RPT161]|uniref:peptidase inhibitor family I36 protein n=1 Tax=Streptomyces sp. RPT161 TaxID=3015993 RepID=UPI0022B8C226|nr:peptidase inhibitor family I36 protein [Streptomyces sp. RPT161]